MNRFSAFVLAAAGVLLLHVPGRTETPDGKAFPSADAAARALVKAAKTDDTAALIEILGPSAKSIVTTRDSVADRNSRKAFTERAAEKMRLVASQGNPKAKTLVV